MNNRDLRVLMGVLCGVLLFLGLTACGGGSTGGGTPETVTADLPEQPSVPDGTTPAPPTGGTPSTPGDPADDDPPEEDPPPAGPPAGPPADPPVDGPPVEDPPVDRPPPGMPPGGGTDPQPPEPLEDLPTLSGLGTVEGVALDPEGKTAYVVPLEGEILFVQMDGEHEVLPHALDLPGVRGLAYDRDRSVLHAVVRRVGETTTELHRISLPDLEPTYVATVPGYEAVESLALHPHDGRLYAIDLEQDLLIRFDPEGTDVQVVLDLPEELQDVKGLASDPGETVLYAADRTSAGVYAIDPETRRVRRMATLGPSHVLDGLAYAEDTGMFAGVIADPGELYVLDLKGLRIDGSQVRALTYDAAADRLYGVAVDHGTLLARRGDEVWPSVIGHLAIPACEGLAWDPQAERLYALSSATSVLYRIEVDTLHTETLGPVHDGANRIFWEGLASLASDGQGLLFTVDRGTGALLRVDPQSLATPRLLATLPADGRIESVAYDPGLQRFHVFANRTQQHLAVDVAASYRVVPVSEGRAEAIGGLAWMPDGERLLGSDVALGEIVVVHEPVPTDLGYADISALVMRPNAAHVEAYDTETRSYFSARIGTAQTELLQRLPEGAAIDALAWDGTREVVWAADNGRETLLTIGSDGAVGTPLPPGVLAGSILRGMAHDPVSDTLYAVDELSQKLVVVDRDTGAVTPAIDGGQPVGFASIEALAWDAGTAMLLAVDRDTRQLVEIEPGTGVGRPVATLSLEAVRGMVCRAATEELLIADAATALVYLVDRFTGEVLEAFVPPDRLRSVGACGSVVLHAPLGDVRARGLGMAIIAVDVDYPGGQKLVFKRGDEVFAALPFEPEKVVTPIEIPADFVELMKPGDEIVWGLEGGGAPATYATFRVVDVPHVKEELASLDANEYLAKQSAAVRDVRRARILLRAGLFTEAGMIFLEVLAREPDREPARRGVIEVVRGLGLDEDRCPMTLELSELWREK